MCSGNERLYKTTQHYLVVFCLFVLSVVTDRFSGVGSQAVFRPKEDGVTEQHVELNSEGP